MSVLDVVTYPDRRLKVKCKKVLENSSEIKTLLNDMLDTMYANSGIGLAAPQVGSDLRLIVIDITDSGYEENEEKEKGEDKELEQKKDTSSCQKIFKLINPEIIEIDDSYLTTTNEGCLSVPEVREDVKRPYKVKVKALDEDFNPLTIDACGILAVCLQHEIDHLNGVLFIDHLSRLKREIITKKLKKLKKAIK